MLEANEVEVITTCDGNIYKPAECNAAEAAPNNGMHPTRIRVDAICKVDGLSCLVRAGDAGR